MRAAAIVGALFLAFGAQPCAAANPEAQVKAAYIYKLASFVRWPDGGAGRGEFRLCVAGRSDVFSALRTLIRGQHVLGLPVTAEKLDSGQVDRARSCQVLFVGRGSGSARGMFAAARGLPILTVGDRNGGAPGGVIDFVIRDGRVRFVIDRDLAARQGLELSSKLLDVALAVDR